MALVVGLCSPLFCLAMLHTGLPLTYIVHGHLFPLLSCLYFSVFRNVTPLHSFCQSLNRTPVFLDVTLALFCYTGKKKFLQTNILPKIHLSFFLHVPRSVRSVPRGSLFSCFLNWNTFSTFGSFSAHYDHHRHRRRSYNHYCAPVFRDVRRGGSDPEGVLCEGAGVRPPRHCGRLGLYGSTSSYLTTVLRPGLPAGHLRPSCHQGQWR